MKLSLKNLAKKIQELRKQAGLTQQQVAEAMELNRQSYTQVENGQRKLDALELAKLADILAVSADELLYSQKKPVAKVEEVSFKFQPKKLEQLLLYVLQACGGRPNFGETVLYKMLYFIDFDAFELFGRPITGLSYLKMKFGPVPLQKQFHGVVNKMVEKEKIHKFIQQYHDKRQKRYVALVEPDARVFTFSEKELIDREIQRLYSMNAIEIENFSHADVPWVETESNQIIDYSLVFQRSLPYRHRDYDEMMQTASGKDILKTLGPISDEEYQYYQNL